MVSGGTRNRIKRCTSLQTPPRWTTHNTATQLRGAYHNQQLEFREELHLLLTCTRTAGFKVDPDLFPSLHIQLCGNHLDSRRLRHIKTKPNKKQKQHKRTAYRQPSRKIPTKNAFIDTNSDATPYST